MGARERRLERCSRAPSSQACRKAVLHSRSNDRLRSGRKPHSVTMTKRSLVRNSRNRVVSRKKSRVARRNYESGKSGLRAWNDAAKTYLADQAYEPFLPDPQPPYVPFETPRTRRSGNF